MSTPKLPSILPKTGIEYANHGLNSGIGWVIPRADGFARVDHMNHHRNGINGLCLPRRQKTQPNNQ